MRRSRSATPLLLTFGLLFAGFAAAPAPAVAQDYPRLGLYGSIMGDGYPYFLSSDSSLVTETIDAVARYHEVILDVNPIDPYKPDVLAALRQRNPNIRVLAYLLGHDIWNANSADSSRHYPTRYRHVVRNLGGFLYTTTGAEYPGANVNLAKRDGSGRYVVAEALADLFYDAVLRSGLWDGIFFDVYCSSIVWSQTPSKQIDYSRAGYSSLSNFDLAWQAGVDTLGNRLRRLAGPNEVIVGNCAAGTNYASFNGWMRENFPYQGGGTWESNMFATPGGYFTDDANFLAPTHNYIFTAMQGSGPPVDPNNARKVRFGLASAALGKGFGVFGPSDRVATTAPYHLYWFDEYSVDRVSGMASTSLTNVGWLGQPLGAPYQMIWAGTNPDAVSNPGFETNVSAWTFVHWDPANGTLTRDATTAAVGSASAKVTITTSAPVDWYLTMSSTGQIPVFAGYTYSATFWAKASVPRTVTVVMSKIGGGQLASRQVELSTQWKQYQVLLHPTQSGGSSMQFYLATSAGSVWIDDAHLQEGATNMWRRDFQNGIVLVNPSNQLLTVPLTNVMRRIDGVVDPVVNNGAQVTSVAINPSDALFLLGDDLAPPAAINDLRVTP